MATAVTPDSSWLSSTKLHKPEGRLEDAARIARAIANLMDPEWREFVEREQQERRTASLSPSEARPLP
jgi:hypothetical protein